VPSRFDCMRPGSVAEACELLAERVPEGDTVIHAGGTDLIVQARSDRFHVSRVVDISRIGELRYLRVLDDGTLRVGALATLSELVEHPSLQGPLIALREAALMVGSIQIRNRATLIGNICNASPAADTVPPLVIFGARINIVGPAGKRTQAVIDFITAPGRTTLTEGELVESVDIPVPAVRTASAYARMTRRRAVDLATTDVAALVDMDGTVRFSYGAVSPRPILGVRAAAVLAGREPDDELLAKAALAAEEEIDPISDVRGSKDYRRAMTGVLARRTFLTAWNRLRGEGEVERV
jgi:CO/xanthine dehydrogenase FAD-binding subunit